MKKSNKIIALCLSFVLLFAAVGGTIARLTDKDKAENVFTVGNIDIQIKSDTPLIEPYYIKDGNAYGIRDAVVNATATTENGKTTFSGLVPGLRTYLKSTVENVGKNDAYVRIAVVLNNVAEMNDAIDGYFEPLYTAQFKAENPEKSDAEIKAMVEDAVQEIYDEMFNIGDTWGMQHKKTAEEPRRMWLLERDQENYLYSDMAVKIANLDGISSYYQYSCTNKFQTDDEKNDSEHDGDLIPGYQKGYYEAALNPNERVYVFYAKLSAHKQDTGSYYWDDEITLFNGIKVPACFDNENMKMFENFEIGFYADAIQVEGFASAEDAFQALEEQHPLGWWNYENTTNG